MTASAQLGRLWGRQGAGSPAPTPLPGLSGVADRLRQLGAVLHLTAATAWLAAALLGAAGAGAVALVVGRALRRRRRLAAMAAGGTWLHLIPPPEVEPASAATFWAALHLRAEDAPWIVWHFQADQGGAGLWAWVPDVVLADDLRRAIEGAWPGARTEEGRPEPVAPPQLPPRRAMRAERAAWHAAREARGRGETVDRVVPSTPPQRLEGTELRLRRSPLHRLDTGNPIGLQRLLLAHSRQLEAGEAVVVQVLARPAPAKAYTTLAADHRAMEGDAERLGKAVAGGARRGPAGAPAVDPKLDDALWLVRLRVAVLANHPGRAVSRINAVAAAFGVLRGPSQSLIRRAARVIPGDLRHHHGDLLSLGELATVAALPSATMLEGSRSRVVPASAEVASAGVVLGVSAGRPVAIKPADLLYHAHMVGPTGVGKSTLLTHMGLQLVEAGWSLVAADIAKGDVPDWILARLTPELAAKVCVIDPTAEAVPGLNVLAGADPVLVADQLVGVFSRLYSDAWGARIEQVLRQSFLTLALAGGTLVELPPLLTDDGFRERILAQVLADAGRRRTSYALSKLEGFWAEFDDKTPSQRASLLDPVLYKLDAFLPANVATVVGQVDPKGDPLSLVDEGGLVLLRAPAGVVGDEAARLLASLLAVRWWQRIQGRSAVPEEQRGKLRRCVFVADEAQDMWGSRAKGQGEAATRMLVQARGLGGALVVAHQHLGQLTPDLRSALGPNATTKILFRLDEDDARAFADKVAPEFRQSDLMNLQAHQGVCVPCVNRGRGLPFSFRTEDLPPGSPERVRQALAASASRWARPRAEVEEEMVARHRGHLSLVR
jgi:hypothetical protein